MRVLQINSFDFFSTGNIMLQIAEIGRECGLEMYTAAKRTRTSEEKAVSSKYHYLIGNRYEHALNRVFSSITDMQDTGSIVSTLQFIRYIKKIKPDIIHIHDIAGYYLNLQVFFSFLKRYDKPVIWTLHCCWAYTGRCIYYDYIDCQKWKDGCKKCPQDKKQFPMHLTFDLSAYNFRRKKKLICGLRSLNIVAISNWMKNEAEKSFLNSYPIETIYDGIDLNSFYPERNMNLIENYGLTGKIILLGVASIWSDRKGLKYFFELRKILTDDFAIVLIGLNEEQLKELPYNIIGLKKTFNICELRNWYSNADVFVNPTMEEGLGLVNLEAQACGTPVVSFATGGAVETIDDNITGKFVKKGNVKMLKTAIEEIISKGKEFYKDACIIQATKFNKKDKYLEYIDLYKKVGIKTL